MGSKTLFNAVFIRPEQVVRFLLCMSMGISLFGKHTCKKCKVEGTIDLQVYKIDKILYS